jgi:hypothetical protein
MQQTVVTCPECQEILVPLAANEPGRLVCAKCRHIYKTQPVAAGGPPVAGAACALGLASVVFNIYTGIPAVLLGIASLRTQRRLPQPVRRQRMMAWTGILSAIVFSTAGAVILASMWVGWIPPLALPSWPQFSPPRRFAAVSTAITTVPNAMVPNAMVTQIEIATQLQNASPSPSNEVSTPATVDTTSMTKVLQMDADSASQWRWLHPVDGTDPEQQVPGFHRAFFTLDFDDATWPQADELTENGFAYGKPEGSVDLGEPPSGERFTAYFRCRFDSAEPYQQLVFECECDDAFVLYVDGLEVARHNITADEAYRAFASRAISGTDETRLLQFELTDPLPPGTHVLAISLHNTNATSTDLRLAKVRLLGVPSQ